MDELYPQSIPASHVVNVKPQSLICLCEPRDLHWGLEGDCQSVNSILAETALPSSNPWVTCQAFQEHFEDWEHHCSSHNLDLSRSYTGAEPPKLTGNLEFELAKATPLSGINSNDFNFGFPRETEIQGEVQNFPFHYRTNTMKNNTCNECYLSFPHKSGLDNHASQTQHAPYSCNCGVTFSRIDVLSRHLDKYNPGKLFPCSYCSRFSGIQSFTRKDHLTQHLRGYHNIESIMDSLPPPLFSKRKNLSCPHIKCPSYFATTPQQENEMNYFRTQSELTKHLREVHDESAFPCDAPGCGRIGGKGFFRKRHLIKHQRDHHHDLVAPVSNEVI